ncbi:hypothetical protein TNIN_279171 [Trichonephila inaurata madagascariensis]|uniref:Uncharacterized protein n=1 Tax=Trichonephila inaurata madagascariensis TaxID=2747483 RepID=A0A8X7BPQ9_9ARAC|nr:hypothetical protein TNIN_279171 [Trichonephila inaurata madagascariensis]
MSRAWKAFICDFYPPSQTNPGFENIFPVMSPLGKILQVALSDLAKSNGNLKAECAVRPPVSRVATKKCYVYLPLLFSKVFSKMYPRLRTGTWSTFLAGGSQRRLG